MNFRDFMIGVLFSQMMMVGVGASNILGLFLTHSPSHVIIHMSIVRALVDRGHNVTVITSIPLNDPNPTYRHIFLKSLVAAPEKVNSIVSESMDSPSYLRAIRVFTLVKIISDQYADFATDPDFVNFMKEDNSFDLVILGYLFNANQLGVAAHFKCPVVLSFVVQPFGHVSRLIGSPTQTSFVPLSPFMDPRPMDFSRRVLNFILSIVIMVMSKRLDLFAENQYNKDFPMDKYPSYSELKENISLILFNHHFSEGPVRPLVPGLVEIGGIQIKDTPDKLPAEIEEFLNKSTDGAIFFSLGSNIRSQHIGSKTFDIIFKVLSTLPYNVIWKYDQEDGHRNASNILFKKWLPQDDILAHKNLRLFITHAGKGSTTESEYHEVPMVALPVMADQFNNAEIMEAKGHGVKLSYQTMTEESFREAILNVMRDDKYRNQVQTFSRLYRDRPLTARENAIYWIEYVIRHKGAPHMQSPLKTMNIIQENSLDVILFIILVLYLLLKVGQLLVRLFILVIKFVWKTKMVKNKKE